MHARLVHAFCVHCDTLQEMVHSHIETMVLRYDDDSGAAALSMLTYVAVCKEHSSIGSAGLL